MTNGTDPATSSYIDMTAIGTKLGSLQLMLNKKNVAKEAPIEDEMVQLDSSLGMHLMRRKKHHHRRHHKDRVPKYSSLLFMDDLDGSDVTVFQAEKQ